MNRVCRGKLGCGQTLPESAFWGNSIRCKSCERQRRGMKPFVSRQVAPGKLRCGGCGKALPEASFRLCRAKAKPKPFRNSYCLECERLAKKRSVLRHMNDPEFLARREREYQERLVRDKKRRASPEYMTAREAEAIRRRLEVVQLFRFGYTSKQIQRMTGYGLSTIQQYRREHDKKIGIKVNYTFKQPRIEEVGHGPH
jgi:DNA-binding CsgD family transcriptional regulator